MGWTLAAIADVVGGRLEGRGDRIVQGIASLGVAGPDDLTLVVSQQQLPAFLGSSGAAALVPEGTVAPGRDVILHRNPYVALAKTLEMMYPPERVAPGIHPAAYVDDTAKVGEGVRVGPHAIVQRNAVLGDGVRIGAGAYVGRNVHVGAGTVLFPHAVLYERVTIGRDCIVHSGAVVGADGFGFTREAGRHRKIPQVGGVVIGDDVEIGANSCIDAGTMEPTRIGNNTKIDNLVQIGHNCVVGDRVIICGAASLAGSVKVEDDATLAGQAGIAGHLTIGAGAIVGARGGVISDIEPKSVVSGFPALPMDEWRKSQAALRRLPDLLHEVRELRRRVDELEKPKG
jgi:UDP-3-O-[3-hydroxymyristoyl] glucosamine N-acyltransferase